MWKRRAGEALVHILGFRFPGKALKWASLWEHVIRNLSRLSFLHVAIMEPSVVWSWVGVSPTTLLCVFYNLNDLGASVTVLVQNFC